MYEVTNILALAKQCLPRIKSFNYKTHNFFGLSNLRVYWYNICSFLCLKCFNIICNKSYSCTCLCVCTLFANFVTHIHWPKCTISSHFYIPCVVYETKCCFPSMKFSTRLIYLGGNRRMISPGKMPGILNCQKVVLWPTIL